LRSAGFGAAGYPFPFSCGHRICVARHWPWGTLAIARPLTFTSYASPWEAAPRPAPPGATLLAVGDVHGHLAHLDALLATLRPVADAARERGDAPHLVMIGDYIDRGPASLAVLDRVALLEEAWGPGLHALMGNHDELLLRLLTRPRDVLLRDWRRKGGDTVLRELGVAKGELWLRSARSAAALLRERLGPERLHLLRRLAPAWRYGDWVFVHAGIDPRRPLEEQRPESWLTLREPFLTGRVWPHDFAVVHGHTVRGPELLPHRIAIDSGVYRTGVLTAVEITGSLLRFVCVTHRKDLAALQALPSAPQERQFTPIAPELQPELPDKVTER
jgi:serine/threonine protein phosphatase 1